VHADDLLAADFGEAEVGVGDSDIRRHRKLGGKVSVLLARLAYRK
jgi:hypothetical protein